VVEPRFRWTFPAAFSLAPELVEAARRHALSTRVAGILAARGISGAADLDAWFGTPHAGLHDPALLPDAALAVTRFERAKAGHERVLVFGDFDADGLTGLTILVLALRRFGVDALPYVPSRLEEGHGLSLASLDAAEAAGASLIVTVDCGSTSGAEIAEARRRGIDVIVTDHHRVPSVLPEAVALVNPHRPDSVYPDHRLAGSGVAFKVACLLLRDEPGGRDAALELADLATIGTVADVAPIVGENRAIARLGLELLRRGPRPGLAALFAHGGIKPDAVDLESVAFAIAPRLNAAGRVGEAAEAARLLLAEDPAEALLRAEALEAANATRRDLMKAAVADARARLEGAPDAPATLVHGPWSVGIIGLVASRLAEDRGRPAVVGADLGPVIRASCRSDGVLDLGAALEECADLFVRHGGHAGAAGFEIQANRWDEFVGRFSALAASAAPRDPRLSLAIDLAIPALDVDYALHRDLARLEPCGPGNPEPLIAIVGLTATRVRPASGGHSQLTLKRRLDVLDGIAFGRPDIAEVVREGDHLDVVARVTSRRFGGFESLQLDIRDVATAGSHPETAALLGSLPSAPSLAGVPA
jgi:single-stranded-DNA-specific exonuclease